jgi:DtxR family transcriptional regulator, Mn-dependent transcriptional regulator
MPLSLWAWLKRGSGTPWNHACVAGAPVPSLDFCAALDCDSVCLTQLRPGDGGSVSCLQSPASESACRLAAMGVLPGVEVFVVQRYPALVFRIGHAEFAVDEPLARHVRVHRFIHSA